MRKLFFCIIGAGLFVSCQKEISEINDGPNDNDNTGLLEKTVSVSGQNNSDTVTVMYEYDTGNRLVMEKTTAKVNEASGRVIRNFSAKYDRDPAGRIVAITRVGPYDDFAPGDDTLTETVNYENASSNRIVNLNDGHTVFEYGVNGRITKTMVYQPYPLQTGPLKLVAYHQYTYDANDNMIKREEFRDSDNNGIFELNITYEFRYDNNINPLQAKDDALLEWKWSQLSPNNMIKQKNNITNPSVPDDEINIVYEYNADKKPAASLMMGNGSTIQTHFYYK